MPQGVALSSPLRYGSHISKLSSLGAHIMVWTVNFTRNGVALSKSFPTWFAMMLWVSEASDITVTDYK